MRALSLLVFTAAVLTTTVDAWGHDGHYLVGAMADMFLEKALVVRQRLDTILGKKRTRLARVAAWADQIKGEPGYDHRLSPLHYVDTKDTPPNQCQYRTVDCYDAETNQYGWCVTGAITNMTLWLNVHQNNLKTSSLLAPESATYGDSDASSSYLSSASGSAVDEDGFSVSRRRRRPHKPNPQPPSEPTQPVAGHYTPQDLVKFIVHFVGDVHQPLHVEGALRGGTHFPLVWDTYHETLHTVWDSSILMRRMKEMSSSNTNSYLARNEYIAYLEDLWNTKYKSIAVKEWSCPRTKEVRTADGRVETVTIENSMMCPSHWASESNVLNCVTAWKGVEQHKVVSEDYYNRNYPIIEEQIIKAGWRLARLIQAALTPSSHAELSNDSEWY